jgi:hypothetical protein
MRFPKFGPVVATSTALLLSAAAPRVALAQGVPMTNWSVSVDFQSERSLSGNLNGDATGVFAGSPAEISSRTYDEVYGRFARFRVSVGYAIGISNEFRVGFGLSRGGAREIDIGTVDGAPLLALYDDLTSAGMDFGFRQYLAPMYSRVRPYFASSLGFAKVNAVQSVLRVPEIGSTTPGVDFYDAATVPTMSYELGVQIRVTYRMAVQVGVDARWQGDLDDLDGLAGTGLEGVNDLSSRWSLPLFAGLTWKF